MTQVQQTQDTHAQQTPTRGGVQLVHRPARTSTPARRGEALHVERPPQVDDSGQGGMGFLGLIPLLGAAGSMTVMMLFRGSPFAAVGALMMIVTVTGAVVMLFSQRGKAGRRRQTLRDLYLEYLERQRYDHLTEEHQMRAQARSCDPEPQALVEVASNPHRLWERRRHHEDFLRLRLGTGTVPAREVRLEGETNAGQQPDPHMEQEMQNLVTRFASAPDMPILVDLQRHGVVSIVGDAQFGHQVVQNLLVSAVVFHSPEDLHLAAAVPASGVRGATDDQWSWMTRLPHILDQSRPTEQGPLNRLAPTLTDLRDLLDDEIRGRYQKYSEVRKNFLVESSSLALARLLVVDLSTEGPSHAIDLPDPSLDPQDLSITSMHVVARQQDEPEQTTLRIRQTAEGFRVEDYRLDPLKPTTSAGTVHRTPASVAVGISRLLAPLRLSPDSLEHSEEIDSQRFTSYLGIRDFSTADINRLWQPRDLPDFLSVPIGVDDRARPVKLDLKESAQHGMGPHGLCVGATGSGKSELLRTLVIGLAATHPPDLLNMVLVDYKGGATFAPFDGVPHVSGIVTNLSDDASLVDRIYASLEGEVQRRQEVLKEAGNMANITDYQQRRRELAEEGEHLPPLPHLFVVIDEFGELLTAQPDFIDLFMSIGRIGRSIGVHLLLSSQRIEAGKLRGLDTNLSYRLGLRTLSAGESRTVLETPDAFHLPPLPGYGYLKVDTTTYSRFKAGYVSGPLTTETAQDDEEDDDAEPLPAAPGSFYAEDTLRQLSRAQHDDADQPPRPVAPVSPSAPTVMSTLVDLMRGYERVTDPIWLSPLPDQITLDQVRDRHRPADTAGEPRSARLRFPIGLLDDPGKQWQGLWELDLTRSGGNLIFLGGPASGKTTALRTTALSLAQNHSVSEVALFGIDLRGSALQPLTELPHSAGMASRGSREALRRTVEEVTDLLEDRERLFEHRGIDSLTTMRSLHAAGELPELGVADVVFLVDGWGGLTDEFEDLQQQVYGILARGGNYGVHVVATGSRWNEVRIAQQTFFGNRTELRLGEPAESAHGRKVAERIPANRPGRGLNVDKLIGQIALPRTDGAAETTTMKSGLTQAVTQISASTQEKTPRRVRMLPTVLAPETLPAADRAGTVPFGLEERTMRPKMLDIHGAERHLTILGDEQTGKSSLLAHIMTTLAGQYTSEEVVFAVYDPRRSLQGLVHEDYLGGYATSASLGQRLTQAVSQELQSRVPDDPLAAAQNSGFDGPRVVLIIDDYDVLTAGGNSPLRDFSEFLAMGAEIGLHAFLARKVRAASRGMFEPFFSAVHDAGASSFLMSGDRSEGPLINGIRPRWQPPGRGLLIQGAAPPSTIQTIFKEGPADAY